MKLNFHPSSSLGIFGVKAKDPGYIYCLYDRGFYKIGRTTDKRKRLQEAKTWLPKLEIIGVKPFWNHSDLEKSLHLGLASVWVTKKWYNFEDDPFEEFFRSEFSAFSDDDINRNSIDFIYMMNGSGMAEFTLAFSEAEHSKIRFLRENSWNRKADPD